MASAAFQKILENLSGNKNVQNLLESFQKLSDEIKKKEAELKGRFDQEKEDKIELAWKKYQEIVKALSVSEAKLEKEVNSTISKIKKSADDLEKNIQAYKKKAIVQKTKLEKTLFKKQTTKKASSKKAAPKAKAATTKKATTKKAVARKTTKKVAKKK
ncbi:actin-binding protein [Bdellovibrio bacteriovorus]|uniref:actin-binding protein n=1 Tax=Bdellovibrio bacteriovorus TaxID=959 RepID=UPI0021D06CDE|nr:actin-binding protein [Bdellovibrio bacteriovorus]UXR64785.1 actin-binding protein [Bdellovibrio bacteriovorus]